MNRASELKAAEEKKDSRASQNSNLTPNLKLIWWSAVKGGFTLYTGDVWESAPPGSWSFYMNLLKNHPLIKSAPQNIINQYEEGRSVPSHLTPAVIDALTASDQEMPNSIDAAPIFELDHHVYDKVLIPGEISDIGFKKAEQAFFLCL